MNNKNRNSRLSSDWSFLDFEEDGLHDPFFAEVLVEGEWIEFGICDRDRKLETTFSFPFGKYLGSSTDTRYDGVRQESWEEPYHFWTRAEQEEE
jgi:hypothetical protein